MSHLTDATLNQYLDGQLEASERAAAEAHLADCLQCRNDLHALRRLFVTLERLRPAAIPVDLAGPVLARLEPTQPSHATPLPALRRGAGMRVPGKAVGALLAVQLALATAVAGWLFPSLQWAIPPDWGLRAIPAWLDITSWALASARVLVAAFQTYVHGLEPVAEALGVTAVGSVAPVPWSLALLALGGVWLVGNTLLVTSFNRAHTVGKEVP